MKIVSWNVNGIRAIYKKGFLNSLDNLKPDILCLQETKAHVDQLEPQMLSPFGKSSYFSQAEKKGYSGTATFFSTPNVDVRHGIGIKKFDSEGRFVITTHKDISIYNIYFPNGASGKERHDYKMEFLKEFKEHVSLGVRDGKKIIVLGDFNIAPKNIDIYDPIKHAKTSGFLPEEKEWFESFLDLGFVDTFRLLHPEEKNRYSWWNQIERARLGNRGWRIDLICITKNLITNLQSAEIHDEIEGSDHCPVSIEIA